jgi:hypothetical protein
MFRVLSCEVGVGGGGYGVVADLKGGKPFYSTVRKNRFLYAPDSGTACSTGV